MWIRGWRRRSPSSKRRCCVICEDSAPYFHNGSAPKIRRRGESLHPDVAIGSCGAMRNAPPEFANMSLSADDVAALVAFLQSLTEDYDDA